MGNLKSQKSAQVRKSLVLSNQANDMLFTEITRGSPSQKNQAVMGGKLFNPDDVQFSNSNSPIQKKIQARMQEI